MGNKKDSLGDRMKENYENRAKTYLTRRTPVIIRLDGKAFHTFTRNFVKPYDEVFHNTMNKTTKYLCENIQNCKLGYTQSDEITLLLTDYDTLTTDAWFDYSVQKMCSISASMATLVFNKYLMEEVFNYQMSIKDKNKIEIGCPKDFCFTTLDENIEKQYLAYTKALDKGAMFDARCFNVPADEVTNCFIWRQQDATRNAVQMLGQTYFSHKELEGKSNNDIQDMLMTKKEINFNDMPIEFKRGVCCIKKQIPCAERECGYKTEWVIDKEIPIFTQDRYYIESKFRGE